MAYHRPLPAGSTFVEDGIWQTTRGKYVCAVCGSFNWWLENMRRHIAEPHDPCRYCGLRFTKVGMHEWKCPDRPPRPETPMPTPPSQQLAESADHLRRRPTLRDLFDEHEPDSDCEHDALRDVRRYALVEEYRGKRRWITTHHTPADAASYNLRNEDAWEVITLVDLDTGDQFAAHHSIRWDCTTPLPHADTPSGACGACLTPPGGTHGPRCENYAVMLRRSHA